VDSASARGRLALVDGAVIQPLVSQRAARAPDDARGLGTLIGLIKTELELHFDVGANA
jgi:hypothetical protein